jgi:anti-anti-sigma factor
MIELAAVDYIDSSGLGMLTDCFGEMEQSGGRMRVTGANGLVARI